MTPTQKEEPQYEYDPVEANRRFNEFMGERMQFERDVKEDINRAYEKYVLNRKDR